MGDPLGTARHTQTRNPHLSDQDRSLEPRKRNEYEYEPEHISESSSTNSESTAGSKLTGAQAVHRDIWNWRVCGPVQGLGFQTWERQQQRLWKAVTSFLYQLIINMTAELNQFGT